MNSQLSLQVLSRKAANSDSLPKNRTLPEIVRLDRLLVQAGGLAHEWQGPDGCHYILLGDVVGIRRADGSLSDATMLKLETACFENPDRIPEVEGRFIIVKSSPDGCCEIWADRFGRVDIYWQSVDGGIVLATGIDMLPVAESGAGLSQVGMAHALVVYGNRPAKQHTLYDGVHRLGVDQGIRLNGGEIELLSRKFTPLRTGSYGPRQNDEYADIFLEALRARASKEGNIVYLSSGWDSTSILAGLVHLLGNRKVRAVIGRMRYADRSGVINQFEIDRAAAVADYFGVPLDICELDYRNDGRAILESALPILRAQQFANIAGLNHWLLARHAAKTSKGGETVFAGEMSDGAHNLGFSQFVTIFHPASQDFREYSDKMASYLFGPTFLRQVLDGKHEQDPIWQLFKQRASTTVLDEIAANPAHRTKQLLASFFLRGGRTPSFTSLSNSRLLTDAGREAYAVEMEATYLERAGREATPETLYSWYLHLYNSFHWQGATVATLEQTAAAHGLRCVLPFHDGRLIEFLSAMPESWGRGLDLNPTKYPLKWMLQNRIDYPKHLQVGPHSYLYDVDPSFSHTGELLFGSSLAAVFKKALGSNVLQGKLDSRMFDRDYIERIVNRYLSNEEFSGVEMNDLGVLAFQSAVGVYGA
jgi:hypothetical protein